MLQPERLALLAFGAHPDDIEFACGSVIARETRAGAAAHFVVCSRGESASHGSPQLRTIEAEKAAALLGATLEFLDLDGDGRLESRPAHAIAVATLIRRFKPAIVLAPTTVENQHPDHAALGRIVRDACRLARYGGLAELRELAPHATGALLCYAVTIEAEPRDLAPVLLDVSDPAVVAAWTAAMEAHVSQASTRDYVALQLRRAQLWGARCGASHAIALFPNDPPVFDSLAALARSARQF